jgi:predicted O-methyltransferase YrrM
MPIVSPAIEEYLRRITPPGDAVQQEMEHLAETRRFPIVGPQVGRLLGVLARSVGARSVFECGSGFGYSALWFARAVPDDGRVVLTDSRAENCDAARGYLERAGLLGRCDIRQGDGLEILASESGPFDVIFCDIDKRDYPKVHPLIGTRLRRGGLLICDNMLWRGRVTGPDQDDDTNGVRELTRRLYSDPGLETTLLPLRDGVSVSLRR